MNRIRLATQEEIETIKDVADLDVGCNVFALNPNADGSGKPGLAVRRICTEIDPLVTDGLSTRFKAIFIRDLETVMTAQATAHYYFNVDPDDIHWIEFIQKCGAGQVSPKPLLRFKRILS